MIAFIAAGILKGATGAGVPIITVPVISAFYDVRIAVVIMVIPNVLTNVHQLYIYRKSILPLNLTFPQCSKPLNLTAVKRFGHLAVKSRTLVSAVRSNQYPVPVKLNKGAELKPYGAHPHRHRIT